MSLPPDGSDPAAAPDALGLRALLQEVVERVEGVAQLGDRIQALLQAVMSIGSHLDLAEVLRSIAETAAELAGAQYSALGVLDVAGDELSDFITVGIDDDQREVIGELPHGRGVLGLLIREPHADPAGRPVAAPRVVRLPAGPPADADLPRRADPGARARSTGTST